MGAFDRTKLLIGEENLAVLRNSSVLLFGVGGVGGFAAEALARSGIGSITVVDADTVDESNINRQIIANTGNIGQDKTEAIKERLASISPDINVTCIKTFFLPQNSEAVSFKGYDFVIDAVDTVSAKLEIISKAAEEGVPVISCMGTGGKTDPTMLKVSEIEKTSVCPLARVMRRELKKRGLSKVRVIYSEEETVINEEQAALAERKNGRIAPPSMIFVPASAGLLAAREAVFTIIKNKGKIK